jgi:hypothetical protein
MIELEFRNVEREENWRKTLKARERINNKLNSYLTASLEIKPEFTVVRSERLAAKPPMLPI